MHFPLEYAKAVIADRHEGLRNAQRTGLAYESRPRRRLTLRWPVGWKESTGSYQEAAEAR